MLGQFKVAGAGLVKTGIQEKLIDRLAFGLLLETSDIADLSNSKDADGTGLSFASTMNKRYSCSY